MSNPLSDLTVEAFLILRSLFFDSNGKPIAYPLPPKNNTQDDPFDTYVYQKLKRALPKDADCIKAEGPLVSPDMCLLRPSACNDASHQDLRNDSARIVGIEVKKLERGVGGTIARASGLDFNSTPPCGTIRIYDQDKKPLDIPSYYMFVCQQDMPSCPGYYELSALTLCDGNLLNADFNYYLSIVGERSKQVGVGTYGDGANRVRPMVIFSNPLGVVELDRSITLIHAKGDLESRCPNLGLAGKITRTTALKESRTFYCYRLKSDLPEKYNPFDLVDPFPVPKREEKTAQRGRFCVGIRPKPARPALHEDSQ